MADYLLENVNLYVSKRKETSLNTDYTLGTDYLRALSTAPAFVLPQIEFVSDAGKPGNGHEFPTRQCPTYVGHPGFSFTDEINVSYAGRLLMRALGGAVTDTQQGGTAAWKHSCVMLDALVSRQLPSTTMIAEIGGASFRLPGMVVDRYRLEQNRADPPRYSVDLVGTGKFTRPHAVGVQQVETATAAGTITAAGNATVIVTAANMLGSPVTVSVAVANAHAAATWAQKVRDALTAHLVISRFFIVSGSTTSIVLTARATGPNDPTMNISLDNGTCTGITPALTSANTTAGAVTLPGTADILTCLDGNQTVIQWTDQAGVQTFTGGSGCAVRASSIEVANATKLNDRCPGDPTLAITDGPLTTNPAYVAKLRHGARSVSGRIVIALDSEIPDWLTFGVNDVLTDVTFQYRGAIIASTFRFMLSMIMPKARITSMEPIENDGDAAMAINLTGFWDGATGTALKAEVQNTETSNYD